MKRRNRMSRSFSRAWLPAVGALLASSVTCGGTAIIDSSDGTGGTSAGTSTGPSTGTVTGTSTGTPSGTSTGTPSGTPTGTPDCEALRERLSLAFEDAVFCDPGINTPQCTGATLIKDACGCERAANDLEPDKAALALEAYDAVEAAGCVLDCYYCPDPDGPWTCQMLPIGTYGTCEIAN